MEVSGQLHDPAALLPGKEPLVPHWIGGWVGPRAVLNAVVKRKILSPLRESNPRTPFVPWFYFCGIIKGLSHTIIIIFSIYPVVHRVYLSRRTAEYSASL
jgi:hypothetical protein